MKLTNQHISPEAPIIAVSDDFKGRVLDRGADGFYGCTANYWRSR